MKPDQDKLDIIRQNVTDTIALARGKYDRSWMGVLEVGLLNPLPDNWRFTEHGLRELFKEWASVKVTAIETEGRELMPVCYRVIAVK